MSKEGGKMRMIIAVAGALALSVAFAAYRYEISGYPPPSLAAAATSACHVDTGRGWQARVMEVLEARYRTMLESEARLLVTTPFIGYRLIVR